MTTYRAGVLLALAAASLLAACRSLPLPNAPDESLVVFLTDIGEGTWDSGRNRLAGGSLMVRHLSSMKQYSVAVQNGEGFAAMALPPGEYLLSYLYLDCQRTEGGKTGTWQDRKPLAGTFYVEANTVQICPRGVQATVRANGYYLTTLVTIGRSYTERKQAIRALLAKDRRWAAWEEYQLVNFGT
jgi:hypothetical protein